MLLCLLASMDALHLLRGVVVLLLTRLTVDVHNVSPNVRLASVQLVGDVHLACTICSHVVISFKISLGGVRQVPITINHLSRCPPMDLPVCVLQCR